jgi:hypothetical protein
MRGLLTAVASLGTGGTLVCCVLPSVLVALSAGSTVVSLVGVFPWLVTLSEHKEWVFGIGLALLALAWYALITQWNVCPADPEEGRRCLRAKRRSRVVLAIVTAVQLMAAFYSLVLPGLIA